MGKEELELSLFAMTWSTQKILIQFFKERKNELSNFIGYEINIEKPIVFIYTSNEQSKDKIKKIIPFIKTSKRIKYWGIGLSLKAHDLYTKI